MIRYILGLGTNLGDLYENLKLAISALGGFEQISYVYETMPVGGPLNQGNYLNLALECSCSRGPFEMLEFVGAIEKDLGRVRLEKNGPRVIDIDIIYAYGVRIRTQVLEIPHPRAFERGFVVAPLFDLDRDLCFAYSPEMALQLENISDEIGDQVMPGVRRLGSLI